MIKKTLVLGTSLKTVRYSNIAIEMLREYHHPVLAFGLRKGIVNDVEIVTSIDKIDTINIDTITLYLNPERQRDYYPFILNANPKRVIFNPGTENTELMELLDKKDIFYEVACTLTLLRTNQY